MDRKSTSLLIVGTAATVLGILLWSKSTTPPASAPGAAPATDAVPTLQARSPASLEGDRGVGSSGSTGTVSSSATLDDKVRSDVAAAFLSPGTIALPSEKVLQEFEKMGFKLEPRTESNPETGTRKTYTQSEPHGGMFDVNVQYASDASGRESLEGIRMSTAAANFEKVVTDLEARAGQGWALQKKEGNLVVWTGPEGYTLWVRKYSEQDPPPQGNDPNIVKMALELGSE